MKIIIIACFALSIAILPAPAYSQEPRGYTEADNNIEVNSGEDFIITLETNYVTDFRWQLKDAMNKDILELVNVEYKLGYARFLGAGGEEVWTFRARKAGKTKISLIYVRPWEANVPAAKEKTFNVTVVVK